MSERLKESRGVRGAITLESNTVDEIKKATVELLTQMIEKNNIDKKDISSAIFTLTKDINAIYPAKIAREELNFDSVPMMCFNELEIEGSLKMCLRVLLSINTNLKQSEINHVYLKGAQVLRKDLIK